MVLSSDRVGAERGTEWKLARGARACPVVGRDARDDGVPGARLREALRLGEHCPLVARRLVHLDAVQEARAVVAAEREDARARRHARLLRRLARARAQRTARLRHARDRLPRVTPDVVALHCSQLVARVITTCKKLAYLYENKPF